MGCLQDTGSVIIHVVFKKTLLRTFQDYKDFLQDVEGINSEAFLGTKAYNAKQNRLWIDQVSGDDCADSDSP